MVTADLLDISASGIGILLSSQLSPGSSVVVRGDLGAERPTPVVAEVVWCVDDIDAGFRAGLAFVTGERDAGSNEKSAEIPDSDEPDYYELLQLSPNADAETIARVYRLLAQRYHPDNRGSGNSEVFLQLSQAYRVLSDPEQRARYDARHLGRNRLRWRIFDQAEAGAGKDEEQRKRRGILMLLYAKMVGDPDRAFITIFELEDLLGCPREHLQAALWYLRGKGFVHRTDNGRFTITVQGFDEVEHNDWVPGTRGLLQLEGAVRNDQPAIVRR